jgi:hypothetical protein
MAYSNFQLKDIIKKFDIIINEKFNLFEHIMEVEYSEHLAFTLKENLTLAISINTEKSRSEMIITPIFLELRRQLNYQISLFSGKDFEGVEIPDYIALISKNDIDSLLRHVSDV